MKEINMQRLTTNLVNCFILEKKNNIVFFLFNDHEKCIKDVMIYYDLILY